MKEYNSGKKDVVKKYLKENINKYKNWNSEKLMYFFDERIGKYHNDKAGIGEPLFKGKGIPKNVFAKYLNIDVNEVDDLLKLIDKNTRAYADATIEVDGDYIQILTGD